MSDKPSCPNGWAEHEVNIGPFGWFVFCYECNALGFYWPGKGTRLLAFQDTVDTLAGILEHKDNDLENAIGDVSHDVHMVESSVETLQNDVSGLEGRIDDL